ncbi:Haloacid dehalogenase domain protein hydrolase [Alkaliphilus metalliredigens QYMF]|uniref:Haloacid dehalogenase domain protein hydrolase n=1 Tax=Alkaliphilus metalliredigens (strain QYMF) TaxID=293826 RepID=A6TMK7_ALKMQ|nr:HAD family hydrolase [Alkaliphilus metalliredigens]ABR47425.1 Haloacid dehalogenase domain protein hydrolase [Alkaliphilus metalliredigens QYMF]
MITTILFDLDGTLLPLDMEAFTKKYFKELGIKLKDYFTAEELTEKIWASSKYMIGNVDPAKTNEEAFFEKFAQLIIWDTEELSPLFKEFYITDFVKIKETTGQSQYIIKAIELLKQKGYQLVVATNPMFPRQAIEHRIQWAGLNRDDFVFITSFEEMHYCKPQIQFYEEILVNINEAPSNCMMIGNDLEEDMIAKQLGMTTYLIEEHLIQRSTNLENVDYRGNYEAFYEFVKGLPALSQ